MKLGEIVKLLNAEVLTPELDLNREVNFAFSSDLMSDVLTRDYEDTVLITGLSNLQAIRTAEMSDLGQVIIARGKAIGDEMIDLAIESDIALIRCTYSLYRISGILYEAGILPIF